MRPTLRWQGTILGLATIAAGLLQSGDAAAREPGATRFSLVWEVAEVTEDRMDHDAASRARFTLRNTGTAPIPAGWTLWFTAIGPAQSANSAFPVERVAGSLFRIRPAAAPALAPGQAISFAISHPGEFIRDDKGPTGPYLVLPGNPGTGIAPQGYTVAGLRRGTPGAKSVLFTDPAEAWRANQAWQTASPQETPPVLPTPKAWQFGQGEPFAVRLALPRLGPGLDQLAARAGAIKASRHGPVLPFKLALGKVPGEASPEAYRLAISRTEGVSLIANSPAGAAHGLSSLEQLLVGGTLRDLEIIDAPRFPHRGLMLDLARNFRSAGEIERIIDSMVQLKLNRLHLHLTDDEGWRIEIPALPELTQIGARRGHSRDWVDRLPPAVGSGPDVADPHGSGFLTGQQYIALVRYAAVRHIEILPEIDMPGHMRAAVKAMEARDLARPEEQGRFRLTDPADRSHYTSAQGYTDNVGDPGLAAFDTFVDTVVSELVRLHAAAGVPLRQIHVGADEAPAGAWEKSPAAIARMTTLGKPGSRAALWEDLFERVARVLDRHGLAMAGWEELGMVPGSASPQESPRFAGRGVTVQVWNTFEGSEGLGNRLANAGYGVVMSPASHLYLDMVQAPDPGEAGHDWVAPLPMAKVYGFDPERPDSKGPQLTAEGRANLVGIEATLFSETVRGPDKLGYMIFPRLVAVAERAWAPRPHWSVEPDPVQAAAGEKAGWAAFSRALGERVLPHFDRAFADIAYRLPAPGAIVSGGRLRANYPWPGVTLRYTADGSAPNSRSPILDGEISAGGTVRIIAVTGSGRMSPETRIEAQP